MALVLAAAIHSGAGLIVTFNLVDFPLDLLAPFGVVAIHPDEVFLGLLNSSADAFCAAARLRRQALKQPPMTAEQFLEKLAAVGLPKTVDRLSSYADRL